MPKMDATAWATWVGVVIMVIGGAISVGVLYRGQEDTAKTLSAFVLHFDDYVKTQDARVNKLDDRVRSVEITQGRR